MRCFPVIIATAFALTCSAAAQTIWHVDDDNCPGPGSGTMADPFCSIQDAIAAASDNDEIVVQPGTYFETIDISGKLVHLRSSDGPQVTAIDGGAADSVIRLENGEPQDTIVEGFTIRNGSATRGGGLRIIQSSPTIVRCVLASNTAEGSSDVRGGGAYIELGSPVLRQCEFTSNSADPDLFGFGAGGGIYSLNADPLIVNCIFQDNLSSFALGGAVHNVSSSPTVINSTFNGNSRGMQSTNGGTPLVVNSIFWNNGDAEVLDAGDTPAATTVNFSAIKGGWSGAGSNNIDAAPRFLNAAAGDFRLNSFSPCIDAGDNGALPSGAAEDAAGNPRRVDDAAVADTGNADAVGPPIVDMGALERQDESGAIIVPAGASVQHAIDVADDGDEIVVIPGTYNEVIDLLGKLIYLRSADGPSVTTISGAGLDDSVVTCVSEEPVDTTIEGFTIADGTGYKETPDDTFTDGGGIRAELSGLTIVNCIVENNQAANGMAIWQDSSTVTMSDCIVRNNTSKELAAYAIGAQFSGISLNNCLIVNNDGLAIIGTQVTLSLAYCTVSGNTAQIVGAITLNESPSTLTASNSIIWGNSSPQIQLANGATANVTFCDVQNGWPGAGNIDADPLFATGPMGDYYLSQIAAGEGVDSPCVNAGSVSAMSAMLTDRTTRTDQLGDVDTVDLGYYYLSNIGACCFQGGGCVLLSDNDCTVAAGQWQGPGVDCASIICFPTGACCLPDGSCMDNVLDTDCPDMGGTFQGDGVACAEVTCPAPTGACCLSDGGCLILTEMDCNQIPDALWGGFGTDCADDDMNGTADFCEAPPCPADIAEDDGLINVFDLLELLANWGADAPGADLAEPLDLVNVFDLLELLAAWGAC